jgi:hypothetical protein
MEVTELREELHNYINLADERFLKMVYVMSKEYKGAFIVGYNPNGTPITQQELRNRVKASSKSVKSGDFITQDEVEKEVESW